MMRQPAATLHEQEQKTQCFHCGDPCESELIRFQEKSFCCQGCRTVFELLQSCDLGDYYKYAEKPGIRQKSNKTNSDFAYLEDETILEKLLDFRSDSLAKVTFVLPSMHCASCIWLIENLSKLFPGIIDSRVNFVKRTASISFDPQVITLSSLVQKLAGIGYEPELNLESVDKKKTISHTRRLITQMGVAGFCFGNIMLLSFPEYLSGSVVVDETYRRFFGYLNFVLGLPVLLFSARDYLSSGWLAVRVKRVNMDVPISLGILALFGRSTYEIFVEGGGGYMDSLAALIFFLLIGKWFQQKTFDSLRFERDYKSYFPISVQRIVDGGELACGIESLRPGEAFRVRSGELIPSDATVLEGEALIDYSFVSGESDPVKVKTGEKVYAGGRQSGAAIVLEALKTVDQSYLTGLWNDDSLGKETHQLEIFADKVGRRFTLAVLIISAVAATYWLIVDPSVAWNAVSAILIVACPCALALSFPFAFGNAVRILGRYGLYLKNAHALGKMAEVNHIVFDKTGTLTRAGDAEVTYAGLDLSENEINAVYSMVSQSGHPLSRYILRKLKTSREEVVPIHSFLEHAGQGLEATIDGKFFRLGSAVFATAPSIDSDPFSSEIHLSVNGDYRGKFLVAKSYRPGLKTLLKGLRQRYDLSLVSGDNDADRPVMQDIFGQSERLHFYQSPHDKKAYLNALTQKGAVTAMVGDGLNDAGALRAADLGISVADDVFRFAPACDAILSSESFGKIEAFFTFSRGALRVVKWSLVFSFAYNTIGIFFAVQGLLEPVIAAILMPVSSITVVGFVTFRTGWLGKKYLKGD